MHKAQLSSDRTSCRSANANQMRLILHTAAFWLMWRIQQEIPKASALAKAEFATLRLRLLKIAARVIESATRIRVAFASACPDAAVFRTIATALRPVLMEIVLSRKHYESVFSAFGIRHVKLTVHLRILYPFFRKSSEPPARAPAVRPARLPVQGEFGFRADAPAHPGRRCARHLPRRQIYTR
jgi:hypothetical protein